MHGEDEDEDECDCDCDCDCGDDMRVSSNRVERRSNAEATTSKVLGSN